jgi:peptidyl-prolyl cis-trans isomerase C
MKSTLAAAMLVGLSFGVTAQEAAEKVYFSVNGSPVTESMLNHLARDLMKPGMKLTPDMQQMLAAEMINRILLSQAAEADKLDQEPANKAGLQMKRISYLATLALKKKMQTYQPSEAEIKALYEQSYSKPSKEFKARHILHKERSQAEASIAALKKGGNFAKLARKQSIGPSAPQGGDLGWFSLDSMVPAFSEAVSSMKKGAFSQTPVKTEFGWHVILLEDSRDLPAKPFDQMEATLSTELRQNALQAYVKELRDKAEIKNDAN